ncbi:MAG: hypothetical protein H8E66_01855 [Planctomycetes bacterium]|nr:hypothetical protein [Planctomycetota bacterium]
MNTPLVGAIILVACTVPHFLSGADAIRPLRVVNVESPESRVDEDDSQDEPQWVILHRQGLSVLGVESGMRTDVSEFSRQYSGSHSSRYLTPSGKIFAYALTRKQLTVARVSDGKTIVQANANELVGHLNWPTQSFLSNDGSHLFTLATHNRRKLIRVDLLPTPRVTATQEIKGGRKDAFTMFASADDPSLIVVSSTGGPGMFRVFDEELNLRYSKKLPQPLGPNAVSNRQDPLILLMPVLGSRWQLIRETSDQYTLLSSAKQWRPTGLDTSIHSAAISPDGKYVVTGPVHLTPTISLWNAADGSLLREVQLLGGTGRLPSDHTIKRLAFSKSGRYLTAGNVRNAFLLDFQQLVTADDSSQ